MSDRTNIAWTDATWSPVRVPEHLADPLRWRKPRRVFVCSMSDLFHEQVPDDYIAAVFGVMAACPRHTFQVLTKRPKRMRDWCSDAATPARVDLFKHVALAGRIEEFFVPERIEPIAEWPGYFITSKGRVLSDNKGLRREMKPMPGEQGHSRVMFYRGEETWRPLIHRLVLATFDKSTTATAEHDLQGCHIDGDATNNALWNLRWGDQEANWSDSKRHGTRRRYSKLTEAQVAELRALHASGLTGAELGRRFGVSDTQARNVATGRQWAPDDLPVWPLPSAWLGVSAETQATADERIPILLATPAAVRFVSCEPLLGPVGLARHFPHAHGMRDDRFWVIAGGESGPGARPCDVQWLRSIVAQCKAAAVPVFCKQLGGHPNKRAVMANWPADLRVQEWPR